MVKDIKRIVFQFQIVFQSRYFLQDFFFFIYIYKVAAEQPTPHSHSPLRQNIRQS